MYSTELNYWKYKGDGGIFIQNWIELVTSYSGGHKCSHGAWFFIKTINSQQTEDIQLSSISHLIALTLSFLTRYCTFIYNLYLQRYLCLKPLWSLEHFWLFFVLLFFFSIFPWNSVILTRFFVHKLTNTSSTCSITCSNETYLWQHPYQHYSMCNPRCFCSAYHARICCRHSHS